MDLTIEGLTRSYGETRVLQGVDLRVPAGSLTAILGPSGCGKTTLLRLVAGFDEPDGGRIQLGEQTLTGDGRSIPPERRQIGYVAQEGALFPHLTVGANIRFGLRAGAERDRQRVDALLELVGLDSAWSGRYPHQLSGGQQQRVALARALAPAPRVILLDEPFASLDASLRDSTRRAIARSLAATGTTTILVTHDQAEALSLADQVGVMRHGRLSQVAPPAELYRRPVDVETATSLGEAVILQAVVRRGVADCALGRLAVYPDFSGTSTGGDGPTRLMLRPEQIVIEPPVATGDVGGAPGRAPARVLETTYYGHDAVVRLELADGVVVTARPPGYAAPRAGELVSLAVRGPAHVFPA
jgi:iron(III) transport system ATP-binding protein